MTSFDQVILTPLLDSIATHANRQALLINGEPYTYRQLGLRISAIRHALQQQHIHHQTVALLLDDHIDTYASIIALWFEGNAYLPLNPRWPEQRNLDIIHQTSAKHLLYTDINAPILQQFSTIGTSAIPTTTLPTPTSQQSAPYPTDDNDLAYILFTSGSTGKPKGVCITRDNLASFIQSFWHTGINITSSDRCLQAFDLTFDVSIQTFLTAFLPGACLCTIPTAQVKYLYAAMLITEQGITCAAMAPSMLTYLRPYFSQLNASSLRTTILTAEACPAYLAQEWSKCAVNTQIFDLYGPTEATVYSTCFHLPTPYTDNTPNGILPIGKPLLNIDAIIIDSDLNPLPANQEGELCLAGRQVTPGYWQNPSQDAAAFITTPDGKRYYRTGDLCTLLPDGNILYHGRIDQQAKIQGYRVELGEIEHHAATYLKHHSRTVAVTYQSPQGLDQIALFIEDDPDTHTSNDNDLLDHLKTMMPQYMIPSCIIHHCPLPLNNNQKIDRNALKTIISQHATKNA